MKNYEEIISAHKAAIPQLEAAIKHRGSYKTILRPNKGRIHSGLYT